VAKRVKPAGKPTAPAAAAAAAAAADRAAKAALDAMVKEKPYLRGANDLRKARSAKRLLNGEADAQTAFVLFAARRFGAVRKTVRPADPSDPTDFFNIHHEPGYSWHAAHMTGLLLARKGLPLSDAQVSEVLGEVARFDHLAVFTTPFLPALAGWLEKHPERMTAAARGSARKIAKALLTIEGAAENRLSARFARLAGTSTASRR
jgi:hypothetical protein